MRLRAWMAMVAMAGGVAAATGQAQKGPALADVLQAAASYLVEYSQRLGAVQTEEALIQRETSAGTFGTGHTWKAELVLLGFGTGEIGAYRDVFEVENSPARTPDGRLLKLFRDDPTQGLREAEKLTASSAGLAIAPAMTAFNIPTFALAYVRKANQPRSNFKLDGVKNVNGAQVATIKFVEQGKAQPLAGFEPGKMQGTFWIDAAKGIVQKTEMLFTNSELDVRAGVTYALEPKIDVWLPVSLDAKYEMTGGGNGSATVVGQGQTPNAYRSHQTIESSVKYSKFQQAAVDVAKLK